MKTIGFFEEQLPNGVVTRSSNRLMCAAALAMAFLLIIVSLIFSFWSWDVLTGMIKDKLITPTDMKVMLMGFGITDTGLIVMLLTYAFGFKAYAKKQELTATDAETPVIEK